MLTKSPKPGVSTTLSRRRTPFSSMSAFVRVKMQETRGQRGRSRRVGLGGGVYAQQARDPILQVLPFPSLHLNQSQRTTLDFDAQTSPPPSTSFLPPLASARARKPGQKGANHRAEDQERRNGTKRERTCTSTLHSHGRPPFLTRCGVDLLRLDRRGEEGVD